jgi:hypothetical protein
VVELDAAASGGGRRRPASPAPGGQVEHLEDPVEADQRGHHVDPHVGEPLQRSEQPQQQVAERDQGADAEAPLDRQVAADAVDQRGRERGHQHHRGAEDP